MGATANINAQTGHYSLLVFIIIINKSMNITEISDKKGSYAAVRFDTDTQHAIVEYQNDNGLPAALDQNDLHATVMYSTEFIPEYEEIGDIDPAWTGTFSHFDVFGSGEENALVMIFECGELHDRWTELRKDGATWDYPTYQPHVTLSYNVGDINPKELAPFKGPINIVHEYGEELSLDWADDKK